MTIGFIAAAYSIVANDAIQTLGTFLSSNSKKPWWALWLFSCSILTAVILYSWFSYGGDVSYGRLSGKFPVPTHFTWIHVVPPLIILILTKYGIPVSTTFLVLTVFAPTALGPILVKSLLGYGVAFATGLGIYLLVSKTIEKKFIDNSHNGKPAASYWTTLQWISTGFLWSQWLIQDLANIYVYMPTRQLNLPMIVGSIALLLLLHAYIFYRRGGKIQAIVTSKTNTTDIRSATVIDFIYALILLFFKEISNIPMSTTWVFLGLLAGRELAITLQLVVRRKTNTFSMIFKDMQKATLGLAVSVALAFGLPYVNNIISGTSPAEKTTLNLEPPSEPVITTSSRSTFDRFEQSIEKLRDKVKN